MYVCSTKKFLSRAGTNTGIKLIITLQYLSNLMQFVRKTIHRLMFSNLQIQYNTYFICVEIFVVLDFYHRC